MRLLTLSISARNINSLLRFLRHFSLASEAGVGAAVGKNLISFAVPCHRALGKSGALTGYHWGITRKQAMIGCEAGQVGVN
jgi:AraC family transcriptional regulator, regulatory protein of adaptative response / methylated-DNA-[protein]-cysteine methyltransferase